MRLSTLFATIGLVFVMTVALPAQTVRVIFVSGEASLQRPDEPALRAIVKGETVVIGTRIVTGPDGRVVLTPMPGVKSIITPNTTLILESSSETRTSPTETTHQATLDLKEGAVVSDLQKPEGVSYDYSIRTARGLAGARGTTFTVGINAAGIQTIVVAHGTISINFTDGRQASLAIGQLSITQANGDTRSVGKISDLPEADQKIAQSWTETTINALAAALEDGVEVDPTALQNALEAAKSLGIILSSETNANVERALAKARELADAVKEIDPLKEVRDDIQRDDIQTFVTEREQSPSDPAKPDDPDNPGPTARDLFIASLTPGQRAAFEALPTDIQDQLIAINDSTITTVALSPDPRTELPHTHQDLRTQLTAIQDLSPEAVAFLKTLAGPNLVNFDYTPDFAAWSPEAFERTLSTWKSLSPSEQNLIISLGAGEALMDKSAGYISGLLADLSPEQRDVISQTGWGAFLDDLAGKPTGSNVLQSVAHDLDAAGRAAVKFFGITPHQLHQYSALQLIEAFASMSKADQRLLRQLGISDAALASINSYQLGFSPMTEILVDYGEHLRNALAFYNRLSSEEKTAARALGLGHIFYHLDPDSVLGESGVTALQRVRTFAQFYLKNPDLQQALRDSRLLSSPRFGYAWEPPVNLSELKDILNTYSALPLRTRHYLSLHDYDLYELVNPDPYSFSSGMYRSLETINTILSQLSASEFATLLDLDLGRVIFEAGYQVEGIEPFPFIDGSPVDEIQATIGYYNSLSRARKFVLRELGIIGDGNIAIIGADVDGLNRLLSAYGSLPASLRSRTERLDEDSTYYSTYGSSEGPEQDRSFFFPRSYRTDTYIYGASFRSTGNLYIGATRYLIIHGNPYNTADTFITGPGKDLHLYAADLIELNGTRFSENIRGITMAAATINLIDISFHEGSVASLNSKLGKANFVNPENQVFAPGKVNFLNVSYGGTPLYSDSDLTSPYGANGNIAIGTLKKPAKLPTYQSRNLPH